MKEVLIRLGSDFLSAIVFLVPYLVTGNVVLATSIAIAGAIAQAIRTSRWRGTPGPC
jgi:intracellular septation protein